MLRRGPDREIDALVATWPTSLSSELSLPPRRVHIIGWAGSGKTHLARRLSHVLNTPNHELDFVAYGPTVRPGDTRRDATERIDLLADIAKKPMWITEGIYLWWIDRVLAEADLVIWLDMPRRIAARRILTRHVTASIRRRNRYKGLRLLWNFWWSAQGYYTSRRPPPNDPTSDGSITRRLTVEELSKVGDRLIVCRHPRDVRRLVSTISAGVQTVDTLPASGNSAGTATG